MSNSCYYMRNIWNMNKTDLVAKPIHRHSLSPCFCLLVNSAKWLNRWSKKNFFQKSTRSSVSQPQICQEQTQQPDILYQQNAVETLGQPEATKMFSMKNQILVAFSLLLQAECYLKCVNVQAAKIQQKLNGQRETKRGETLDAFVAGQKTCRSYKLVSWVKTSDYKLSCPVNIL